MKLFGKTLCLGMLASMIFFMPAGSASAGIITGASLNVGNASASPGDEIDLPLFLNGNGGGIGGIAFTMTYDPEQFRFLGIAEGDSVFDPMDFCDDGLVDCANPYDTVGDDAIFTVYNDKGDGTVMFASASAWGMPSGFVFGLEFYVREDAEEGIHNINLFPSTIHNPSAGYDEPTEIPVSTGMPDDSGQPADEFPDTVLDSGTITVLPRSDSGGPTIEIRDGDPVVFNFHGGLRSEGSSVMIDPPAGGGRITVGAEEGASEEFAGSALFACDIDDSEYTGGFPVKVKFTWSAPELPADADTGNIRLLFSEHGEDWSVAGGSPDVSDIRWELDSPPYSVSFTTRHFSRWAVAGTESPADHLRKAIRVLQVLTGSGSDETASFEDVNGDGRIGMEEAIWLLGEAAGLR